MAVPLLHAEAAPEGAAPRLQMIQEQNPGHNPILASGRLHGRLACTGGRIVSVEVLDASEHVTEPASIAFELKEAAPR